MAVALLLGAMPTVAGRMATDSRPALTLDICHPLQAFNTIAASCNLPLPRIQTDIPRPAPAEAFVYRATIAKTRLAEGPDPPPPKALA